MDEHKAFLIVDLQNDFMPDGALAVPHADEIIPIINKLIPKFSLVVASQDWHPINHVSFVRQHPKKMVGDIIKVQGQDQVLWPMHCVRTTRGAELTPSLHKEAIACCFYKGTDRWIDGYSAFFDNAHLKSTGLEDYLKSRGVVEIFIAGLATDYCVLYSTLDAIKLGFSVSVIADACRAINLHAQDEERAYERMKKAGAKIIQSNNL
jgi:nicotinamidase/pyrazinamidase